MVSKLKTVAVVVYVTDERTGDKWTVYFEDGNKTGTIYKNKKFVDRYTPNGGLANKSMAMMMIRKCIENQKHKK